MSLAYLPTAADSALAASAVVTDEAHPCDSAVKVSIDGAPAGYVSRAELAMWGGGVADDFSSEWGAAAGDFGFP
jgi:hypothetical protein